MNHIIFDWDGTLARSLDLWLDGYRAVFRDHGHGFSDEVIARDFFHNHEAVPAKYPDLSFGEIAQKVRAHVAERSAGVALYDGAIDALETLRDQGVVLTLVTSSARPILAPALATHGLERMFHSVVTGDDGFGHKPSTRPFEVTLDRAGVPAEATLVIGDSRVDIEAGRALGCQTCWFAPDQNALFHDFDSIRALAPDHEVRAAADIPSLF